MDEEVGVDQVDLDVQRIEPKRCWGDSGDVGLNKYIICLLDKQLLPNHPSHLVMVAGHKQDGVGPVDNKTSTAWLHPFVKKKKK